MTSQKAKAYVDHLYETMYRHWEEKIRNGQLMVQLRAGKLPMPVIRRFFKNWGRYALEVNALNALSYHTHLAFFVRNFDLLGPFCAKIADELISPKPPGHVLGLLKTAEAMGLSREEVLEEPYLAEARARRFFKNWGRYALEVNALNALSYHTHLAFFVRNFDLLGPFCAKIADELISPKPPGHVLGLLKTAEAMGLSREEVLEEPYLAEARAINDFCHKVFIDGSLLELWGLHVFEESLSRWSGEWFKALTTHYNFSPEQAIYFSTHEEADLKPHALGESEEEAMGHGAFNRVVFQRVLEEGMVEYRMGYPLEYCALTMVDLHAAMNRAAIENPYFKKEGK